jgi:hypothetical protein
MAGGQQARSDKRRAIRQRKQTHDKGKTAIRLVEVPAESRGNSGWCFAYPPYSAYGWSYAKVIRHMPYWLSSIHHPSKMFISPFSFMKPCKEA